MAEHARDTEANKRRYSAGLVNKHSPSLACSRLASQAPIVRMPSSYSRHDVEFVLEILWGMFTESQSRKIQVKIPWDDSNEPATIKLADLAAILESWLE
jgi:hypothetical protein